MLTRSATYPDRETAQWATQEVVTRNEQAIHRWLAQGTRPRLTIEAAWPSRTDPVGRVLLQAMAFAGRGPVDVRAAQVVGELDQEISVYVGQPADDTPEQPGQALTACLRQTWHSRPWALSVAEQELRTYARNPRQAPASCCSPGVPEYRLARRQGRGAISRLLAASATRTRSRTRRRRPHR